MVISNFRFFAILLTLFCCKPALGIICDAISDSRFIPQLPRIMLSPDDRCSCFAADLFVLTARSAIGGNEQEIPLGELFGEFDLGKIARAFPAIGKPNPLAQINPAWQDASFVWLVGGKIQGHGLSCFYHQAITDWLSCGASWVFMRTYAHNVFVFKSTNAILTAPADADLKILDNARRAINVELGLPCNKVMQTGFGDVDAYIRAGKRLTYAYRFRTIDAGVRVGVLFPSASLADPLSPASVPFGGQGHWGAYVAADFELELREDMKVGLYGRLSKRFARTCSRRVPTCDEQPLWGVLVIPTRVDPGVTFLLTPYISFENLREGFGVRIRYTLTHHQDDQWCDARKDPTVPANFDVMKKNSEWSSDYISISGFYDFGKMKVDRGFSPIVTLTWDLPTSLVVAHRVPKTNRISLGIEFNF